MKARIGTRRWWRALAAVVPDGEVRSPARRAAEEALGVSRLSLEELKPPAQARLDLPSRLAVQGDHIRTGGPNTLEEGLPVVVERREGQLDLHSSEQWAIPAMVLAVLDQAPDDFSRFRRTFATVALPFESSTQTVVRTKL